MSKIDAYIILFTKCQEILILMKKAQTIRLKMVSTKYSREVDQILRAVPVFTNFHAC